PSFLFLVIRRPASSTLCPYTTLFRSHGVEGTMRILHHLEMLKPRFDAPEPPVKTIVVENSTWMRAKYSGLLHVKIECGKHVEKGDRKSTRLNSSHVKISYAVFCLKKK